MLLQHALAGAEFPLAAGARPAAIANTNMLLAPLP